MRKNSYFHFLFVLLFVSIAMPALNVQAEEAPKVGRKAASRYFEGDRERSARSPSAESSRGGGGDKLLMLSVGTYIGSKSYAWKGSDTRDNVGRASYGVTYLFDDWHGLDLNLRVDFNEYKLDDVFAKKLSFLALITFPKAEARFPLYFGLGAGPGVFLQQVPDESNISLDYQLVGGARFTDLFENFGFFFELGMKNHLHLLSDGQLNGTTMTTGGVFSF